MANDGNILEVINLSKNFGGLNAIKNCSLKIKNKSITGIIGPNGSGKSTLFNLIAGTIKPTSGKVLFNEENVTGYSPHELFKKGILRTFQIPHEFTNLTVLENLMMVPPNQYGENLINALLNRKKWIPNEEIKLATILYNTPQEKPKTSDINTTTDTNIQNTDKQEDPELTKEEKQIIHENLDNPEKIVEKIIKEPKIKGTKVFLNRPAN